MSRAYSRFWMVDTCLALSGQRHRGVDRAWGIRRTPGPTSAAGPAWQACWAGEEERAHLRALEVREMHSLSTAVRKNHALCVWRGGSLGWSACLLRRHPVIGPHGSPLGWLSRLGLILLLLSVLLIFLDKFIPLSILQIKLNQNQTFVRLKHLSKFFFTKNSNHKKS